MATKIVQLEDDKQNSLLYYPVTLGNAVFYNNTALINTTSGKIPTQFLPSYVDDVLEGLYWDTTEFLKVDDDHILARRVNAGSWTDLDGNVITLDTSKYYIDYNEWNAASPDQDLIVYTGSDVAVAHTDWSTDGLLYTGEAGIIYVSVDTNYQYRWTGSQYIQMTSGNFATAARFGATTTPSEYYGLGGDTVLDLPGISLNGGNLYAPVSSIAWWAPTTAGAGSGTLETGNILLSNGATPSAPTWLANPSVSGVTRLMLGTTSGAVWDNTSLPTSSSNASSLMTLSATGAGWMAGPGAGGKILLSYDDGTSPDHDYKLTWTSLSGSGNIDTALATLEVTSAQRGLAPSIPIDTSSNIAPINTDLFIVHASDYTTSTANTLTSSWKRLVYADSNWPSSSVTSMGGLMSGAQIELLKKLEWATLPFSATATLDVTQTVLKPASTATRTVTITATKRDVTTDASGVPGLNNVAVTDKIICSDNSSTAPTGAQLTPPSPTTYGGSQTLQYTLTPSDANSDKFDFKWKAEYKPDGASAPTLSVATGTQTCRLVNQIVWGYLDQNVDATAFNNNLSTIFDGTYSGYAVIDGSAAYFPGVVSASKTFNLSLNKATTLTKLWFAYPTYLGAFVSLKDGNNFIYSVTQMSNSESFATNGHTTTYYVFFKEDAASLVANFLWKVNAT